MPTSARSDFRCGLPFDLRFELDVKRVRLVQMLTAKVNEYLLENRPASSFERIAGIADCDILVSVTRTSPGLRVRAASSSSNCGSVG